VLAPLVVRDVGIPDGNLSPSIVKAVDLGETIAAKAQTGQPAGMRIVAAFHSKNTPIRVYGYDPVAKTYNFLTNVNYNEVLDEKFQLLRVVSGMLKVKSASISSTNAVLKGVMNGLYAQQFPDLRNTSYSEITSYKGMSAAVVPQTVASDGIGALALPCYTNKFFSPSTHIVTNANFRAQATASGFTEGWESVPRDHASLFDSNDVPGFIPANLFGRTRITVMFLAIGASPIVDVPTLRLRVITASADPTDYHQVLSSHAYQLAINKYDDNALIGSTMYTVIGTVDFENSEDIVQIVVNNDSGDAVTVIGDPYITWVNDSVADPRDTGYGAIVTLDGLEAEQEISLSGGCNYEAVPALALAQDVKGNLTALGMHPDEVTDVKMLLSRADQLGIRFIFPLDQEALLMELAKAIATKENVAIFSASGTWDKIKSGFNKVVSVGSKIFSVLSKVAPFLAQRKPRASGLDDGKNFLDKVGKFHNPRLSQTPFGNSTLRQQTILKRFAQFEKAQRLKVKTLKGVPVSEKRHSDVCSSCMKCDSSLIPKCAGPVVDLRPHAITEKVRTQFMNGDRKRAPENVAYFPAVLGKQHLLGAVVFSKTPVTTDGYSWCNIGRTEHKYTQLVSGSNAPLWVDSAANKDAIAAIKGVLARIPDLSGYVSIAAARDFTGPSLGLAIYAAMSGIPHEFIAYTGAISPGGDLLPISSIDAKIEACRQHKLILIGCISDDDVARLDSKMPKNLILDNDLLIGDVTGDKPHFVSSEGLYCTRLAAQYVLAKWGHVLRESPKKPPPPPPSARGVSKTTGRRRGRRI
jgi:hypothetical protein